MIKSFDCNESLKIWNGVKPRKFPSNILNVARRKLRMLNNSVNLLDLRIPPANWLEKLKGSIKGMYNIRVNEKYLIIFNWKAGNAYGVKIIDYHG